VTRLRLFHFSPIIPDDIIRAIDRSSSQAAGVDDLSLSFIMSALITEVDFLCDLLNKFLVLSSEYPSDFQLISLLCFLFKILERIVDDLSLCRI